MRFKKFIVLFLLLLIVFTVSYSQQPIKFEKLLGGGVKQDITKP